MSLHVFAGHPAGMTAADVFEHQNTGVISREAAELAVFFCHYAHSIAVRIGGNYDVRLTLCIF